MKKQISFYKDTNIYTKAKILYSEKDRGFITKPDYITHFTLMIGCGYLGFDINLESMQLMTITGLCPKEIWNKAKLNPPKIIEEGKIFIRTEKKWISGAGDSLREDTPIYFCEKNKWICLGNKNINDYNCSVKFMENAIISLNNEKFEALWIKLI